MILAQMHRGQSTSTTHPLFICLLTLTPGSCMIQPTKLNLLFFGLNFKGGGGCLKKYGQKTYFRGFFMEDLDLPNLSKNVLSSIVWSRFILCKIFSSKTVFSRIVLFKTVSSRIVLYKIGSSRIVLSSIVMLRIALSRIVFSIVFMSKNCHV